MTDIHVTEAGHRANTPEQRERVALHIEARGLSPEDRAMLRAMLLGEGE